MEKAKKTVTTTSLGSWMTAIVVALVTGIVGYLITQNLNGFLVGFVMTILFSLIMMASFIPYVGVYFQWVWSWAVYNWLIHIPNFTALQLGYFHTLVYFPLILFMLFGIVLFGIITGIVTVVLGALIGALVK